MEEIDVTVAGRDVHVTVKELEPVCPAPLRGKRHYESVYSVDLTGDVASLHFGMGERPKIQTSDNEIRFAGVALRFGTARDIVQINGECVGIGQPGSAASLEFDGDPSSPGRHGLIRPWG